MEPPHLQCCPKLLLFSYSSRPTDGPRRAFANTTESRGIIMKDTHSFVFWQLLPNRLGTGEALIAVIALTLTCSDGHSRGWVEGVKKNRHLEAGIRNIQLGCREMG